MNSIPSADLYAIVASVFGVEPSKITEALRPGEIPQWDSLGHMSLMSALEQRFAVVFAMDEVLAVNSIADLRVILKKHGIQVV